MVTILIGKKGSSFVSTWKTDNVGESASNQITIPTVSAGTYDCIVNWGDGILSKIETHDSASWTHTYQDSGTYTVTIVGTFTGLQFNNAGDKLKLLNISQFGRFSLTDGVGYFYGCSNLTIDATDILNTSGVTTFEDAFHDCSSITTIPSLNYWDTSSVLNMGSMFRGCSLFNQKLIFDTSSVTDMSNFLYDCVLFNQQLSFDTSSVTTMASMFSGCEAFNQPVIFDTSLVTTMSSMFRDCALFNQTVNFNTPNLTAINGMFNSCAAFNQPISFDTSLVTNMASVFLSCVAFNQPISFDTSSVTTMSNFLSGCVAFNQPISFDTSSVTNMANLFNGCTAFNQSLSLDTSSATTMSGMLYECASFNQPLNFDTSSVTSMSNMFNDCASFNQPLNFDTSLVANMASMFSGCTAFNQSLSAFNISSLTSAGNMLTSSAFDTTNYDLLLDPVTGWPSQPIIKNNVSLGVGSTQYNSGDPATGRAVLTGTYNWTITDGGVI